MKNTNTTKKPVQGEIENNVSEDKQSSSRNTETNDTKNYSSPASVNLSMRQRSIIDSCFGEDFLL
jgi:hypothetical protein